MARRPELRKEEVLSRDDLKTIAHRLALLNEGAVLDFYKRAHRECEIINSRTFPPPRAVQEWVQAWKQLRKWRK
jgi:hypothetical protein